MCMCGHRAENSTAAPVFRNQLVLGKLLFYAFNISAWFVYFINGHNNFYPRCLCMVNSLNRLRHNAIVCRYNQNCYIGCVGAPHTHCSKCFVPRRIQKCDFLAIDRHYGCSNMLCNAPCFTICYTRRADGVQKGGFPVVDMPHNTDNRRTGCQFGFLFLFFLKQLCNDIHLFFRLCDTVKF